MQPTTAEPRRRWTTGRWLVTLAVVGMLTMWGYVLYLAFGPGRADPPNRLDDPTFARRAEDRCSAALDRIAELPLSIEVTSADERADVLEEANGHLEAMLDDLAALTPAGEDGEMVRAWLADWRTYLGDRQAYAAALHEDPDARLLVSPKGGDHITEHLDAFAADNHMPACSTPTDVG